MEACRVFTANASNKNVLFCQIQAQEGNFKRQQSGPPPFAKLTARVIDANSTQAVEFATISLFRMPKDTLIGGIVTNANGSFELENLRPGKYKMVIAFMGYKSLVIDTLVLRKLEERDLGNIALGSNEKVLKEVTIETQQDMVKNTIDKKVFDAGKLAIANGGSANDVLTQVPTVSVDIDGNISLRGSGNVTILIDGRPSGMSGAGRAGVLSGNVQPLVGHLRPRRGRYRVAGHLRLAAAAHGRYFLHREHQRIRPGRDVNARALADE
jgi:hypothetical protein